MAASSPSKASGETLASVLNRKAGAVIQALDQLHEDEALKDLNLTFPRIIVVGPESCGKSTVLERLINMRLFPKGKGICTRMPIELSLLHRSLPELEAFCAESKLPYVAHEGYCRLAHRVGGSIVNQTGFMTLKTMSGLIQKFHDDLVVKKNGRLTGIITDILVLEIISNRVLNLRLLDLPGIVSAHLPNEPADMAAQTRNLASEYLRDPHSLVLAVVSAAEGFRTSTAMGLVQEYKKENMTVGVLTKADLCQDARPEASADPFHLLKDKMDGKSGDMIDLPAGLVALRNHDTQFDKDKTLDEVTSRETEFFARNLPGQAGKKKAGIGALAEKLVQILLNYTKETWVENASRQIQRRREEKVATRDSLLGPLPPSDRLSFLMRLVDAVCSAWQSDGMVNPDAWSRLFRLPPRLEDVLHKYEQSLECLVPWRDFKAELLDIDVIRAVIEQWLSAIAVLGLRMFEPAWTEPIASRGLKLFRFQNLASTLQQQFFRFDIGRTDQRLLSQLKAMFESFDWQPHERRRVIDYVRSLFRTVVFESIILDSFERSLLISSMAEPLTALVTVALQADETIEDLLVEEPEWAQRRAKYEEEIQNLNSAQDRIQAMAKM